MAPKLLRPEQIKWHPCQQGHPLAELAAENAFGEAVKAFDRGIGAVNDLSGVKPDPDNSRKPYEFHLPTILRR